MLYAILYVFVHSKTTEEQSLQSLGVEMGRINKLLSIGSRSSFYFTVKGRNKYLAAVADWKRAWVYRCGGCNSIFLFRKFLFFIHMFDLSYDSFVTGSAKRGLIAFSIASTWQPITLRYHPEIQSLYTTNIVPLTDEIWRW